MNWAYRINLFFYMVINSMLLIYYFRNILTPKKTGKKYFWIDFLLFFIYLIAMLHLQIFPILKTFVYIIFTSLYVFLTFSDTIDKKIFYNVIQIIINSLIENIPGIILVKILNFSIQFYQENVFLFIITGVISSIIQYILYTGMILIARKNSYYIKSQDLFRLSMFPISQFAILFLIYLTLISNDKQLIAYSFIGALIICFISDIFLIQSIKRISEMSKIEIEHQYLLQQNTLQAQHYATLKSQFEYMHMLRHEIRNHLETVKILMEKNEIEQVHKSVDGLNNIYQDFLSTGYCDNKIVDAVLHNKILYANQNNIDLDITCNIPEKIPVDDIDLMTIFCNLFDNAIEACENNDAGKNSISFHCTVQSGFLIIKCINSKSPHIQSSNGSVSTKKNKENHGFGIKIIKQTTEKYDGTAYFEDQGNTFLSLISLRCEI